MLSRELRLRNPRDFHRAWESGTRWRGRWLTVNVVPNDLPHNRYGFVASKRVGNAVTRNNIKRRLRAAVRQWFPALVDGHDVVIIAHAAAAQAGYHELEGELGLLLRRSGMITGNTAR